MLRQAAVIASIFILRVGTRLIRLSTAVTRSLYRKQMRGALTKIWIDVGAHRGETTFESARKDPNLLVYAFEPDVSVAAHRYSVLDNFVMLAMAVSDVDGVARFNVNSNDRTSSLLCLDQKNLQNRHGVGRLRTVANALVPTTRLDTFFKAAKVEKVDYLKIDAQGHDMDVLRSLGERITDVGMIRVEACARPDSMYRGAHNGVEEIVEFMAARGFGLTENSPETLGQEANLVFTQTGRMADKSRVCNVGAGSAATALEWLGSSGAAA
jgi:FkbM family methyltransferase